VTDVVRRLKSGIRGDPVFPRAALIDPSLTDTLPPPVAAETGFDALTHAVEGYVARRANPISRTLSEKAIVLIGDHVRHAAGAEPDAETRDAMCLAALLGGLNVAAASTCLPHRLQQAMGSADHVGVPHGRGLAAVYPAWLRRAYPYAEAQFDRVASLLGSRDIHDAIGDLISALEMDAGLREWGFDEADLDTFMSGISGNVGNDPIDGIDESLMRGIYVDSL
jgi:alcohol dehydrogenase class IV